MTIRDRLTSLDHLQVFELAARHLSFKEAAKELCVTPAAVGQRIKSLEGFLGYDLFDRKVRSLVLTHKGKLLFEDISIPLSQIKNSVLRHRHRLEKPTIEISTTHSFSELILLPMLDEFTKHHKACDIRIISTNELLDPSSYEVDVCVRLNSKEVPDCNAISLGFQTYIPVCAPELTHNKAINKPIDLLGLPLIEERWGVNDHFTPSWSNWSLKYGNTDSYKQPELSVSTETHAIKSALLGQGVALVSMRAVTNFLLSGELIKPSDGILEDSLRNYQLIWRKSDNTEIIEAFVEWAQQVLSE